MPWGEFCTLLAGIMPETPLGQVVSIRSESDKDTLKNFSKEQHKMRNDWKSRSTKVIIMDKDEMERQTKMFQEIMKSAFGQ